MSEDFEDQEMTPEEAEFALLMTTGTASFLSQLMGLAEVYGVSLSRGQVFGTLLAVTDQYQGKELSRDEWVEIYDKVQTVKEHVLAEAASAQAEAAKTFNTPESVAHAKSHEEAAAGADAWGARVEELAFGAGKITQEDIDKWLGDTYRGE